MLDEFKETFEGIKIYKNLKEAIQVNVQELRLENSVSDFNEADNVQKYFISILSLKKHYCQFQILLFHFAYFFAPISIHFQFFLVLNTNEHFQISCLNLLIDNYNACLYQSYHFIGNLI